MFSSNDLIHLVFANEADTYYCGNLLKLDLHQYLWFKLHEKYAAVYFLTMSEGVFSIKTYGDLKCRAYEPSRKMLKWRGGAEIKELGKWIHKQLVLKQSESAAFVCSLEDFCSVSGQRDWANALDSIAGEKNRTGILVLTAPVSVERSKKLLLYDPVFQYLRENAVLDVRNGAPRDLYGTIKRNKGDSCVFLNTFTWDRVYAVLLHVVLEQKGRILSPEEMDAVAGYLVQYLASLEMQRDDPLFNSRTPGPYMQFQDLYGQLKDDGVWKRLMNRCLRKRNDPVGNTEADKERDPADDPVGNTGPDMEFHLTWDKNCYAGRCMMLQIPNEIKRLDTEGERAADILLAIQHELLRPKNRDENDVLVYEISNFLERLDVVFSGDLGTYKRILEAIHFCVTRMYIQKQSKEEGQVLKIVEFLKGYIGLSGNCYQLRRDVELYRQVSAPGTMLNVSVTKARDMLAAEERKLQKCQEAVGAFIMNLSMTSFSDQTVDQIGELIQEMGASSPVQAPADQVGKLIWEMGDPGPVRAPLGQDEIVSPPVPAPDEDRAENTGKYELNDSDYGTLPPV